MTRGPEAWLEAADMLRAEHHREVGAIRGIAALAVAVGKDWQLEPEARAAVGAMCRAFSSSYAATAARCLNREATCRRRAAELACICNETVVGKSVCPTHGPHPASAELAEPRCATCLDVGRIECRPCCGSGEDAGWCEVCRGSGRVPCPDCGEPLREKPPA